MKKAPQWVIILIAIALPFIALAVRLPLSSYLGDKALFMPFFVAIVVSSALGGVWTGITTTVVSAVLCWIVLLAPGGSIYVTSPADRLQLLLFGLTGIMISLVGEGLRVARRSLDTKSRDLDAMQRDLSRSQDDQLLVLSAGRMGVWDWMLSTNRVNWSASMGTVFGIPQEQFPETVEAYMSLGHPEDRERVGANLQAAIAEGRETFEARYRISPKDGVVRWLSSRGQTLRQGEDIIGLRGICWDVTEEIEASHSHAMLATIVSSSEDGIISKDLNGMILSWNSGAEKIFGYTSEEVIGKSILLLLPEDRLNEETEILARLREGQSIKSLETIRRRKDGKLINVSLTISPIFDEDGKIISVAKFVRDITETKLLEQSEKIAQEERNERERRLTLATEAAELGIFEWDVETGDVRWENDRMYEIFGRERTAVPYSPEAFLESVLPEDRHRIEAEAGAALASQHDSLLLRFQINRESDGAIRTLEIRGTISRTEEGSAKKLVAVVYDLTDRLTAEEQMEIVLSRIDDHLVSYDFEWRYTYVNDGACRVIGKAREELIGKCIWDLFPDAVGNQYFNDLMRASAEQVPVRSEYYYEPFERWFENHIYPSRRGVTVFASDITERKRFEEAFDQSSALLAAQERQLQQLVDSIPVLVSFLDKEAVYRMVNRQYELWFGVEAADIVGRPMREVLGEEAFGVLSQYVDAVLSGEEVTYQTMVPYKGAGPRFVQAHYTPSFDDNDKVNGFFVLVADHSQARQRELDTEFLSDASATLASMVDYRTTLERVANLAVPYFADWCTVDMLIDDETLDRLAVCHKDPEKVAQVIELQKRFPPDPKEDRGVWRVIRTGESELVPLITSDMIDALVANEELKQIVYDLGLYSYICVPISIKGKTIGAISFVSAETQRSFAPDDLRTAEELARRAAISIESALLYDQLQDADRRKDEFIATLAHELRNPLAPLRSGLDILNHASHDPETVREVHHVMERQLTQLVRLVDDLLDVSRITAGKLELRKESVNLRTLIEDAAEATRSLLEDRRHSLFIHAVNDIPEVTADPARMMQVVQNLLNNAAKYTDPGGTIQLTMENTGDKVMISVRDNGIGIDKEHLPDLFKMFSQVESAIDRSHGGLGIGLALVQGLMHLHGGEVEVKSEGRGKGTEFIVQLPVELTPKPAPGDRDAPAKARPLAKRILVVDDNRDISAMLGAMMKLVGHEVETANSGQDAIEKFQGFLPEVVLLDIGMPGMNGYEVAKHLRQTPEGRDVTLIALTGWGSDEDRQQTEAAGFNHHLVKPIQLADLQKLI